MPHARADKELARARRALGRGKVRAALRHSWSAAQDAARADDPDLIAQVRHLAVAAGEQATGRDAREADLLARYCAELSAAREAGIEPTGLMDRLFRFGRDRSKPCPDCAERIKADARVCRYCGFRYPES